MKPLILVMFMLVAVFFAVQNTRYSSAAPVFNVGIDLPITYQVAAPGSQVWFTIDLMNLANKERVDVTLEYSILDKSGNVYASNSKTVAVETQASFVADLDLPADIKPGAYLIFLKVESAAGNSTYTEPISVRRTDNTIYYVGIAILLVIFLAFGYRKFLVMVNQRSRIKNIVKKRLK